MTSKNNIFIGSLLFVVIIASFLTFSGQAFGHPEDDFCGPDSGIDPQLCQQLSELNSSEADLTHPLVDDEGKALSPVEAALHFGKVGVQHILPGGLDHILFVLALFLAATSLRSLILQISVFTVAHTVTLGLTAAGVIEPPASVVEPLIALSIAVVAIETIFKADYGKWRLFVILGFGLFHGMGFAGFIGEIGLPPEQFWPSLIGFNLGVEIGQLTVVLLAVLIAWPLKRLMRDATKHTYRRWVVMPSCVVIAAIGLWWLITRSLGMG